MLLVPPSLAPLSISSNWLFSTRLLLVSSKNEGAEPPTESESRNTLPEAPLRKTVEPQSETIWTLLTSELLAPSNETIRSLLEETLVSRLILKPSILI